MSNVRFSLKLVARALRSRRSSLVRFTAFAAVAGIAAGVAGLIFARALGRGFDEEIRSGLLANIPHISVFRDDGGKLPDAEKMIAAAENIGNVRSAEPVITEQILVSGPNSLEPALLTVNVGDAATNGDPAIRIGAELAKRTGLSAGSNAEMFRFTNGAERANVRVGDVFKTGYFDADSVNVAMSSADHLRLTGGSAFIPTSIKISLDDPFESDKTSAQIREFAGGELRVMDWQEANRPLFNAMAMERAAAFAVILLIILIAALNITTTLALLASERRRDIAILRTCGARARTIIETFFFEGVLVGAAGIFAGIVIGLAACWAANYFRLITLSGEVYLVEHVPLRPSPLDVAIIAAAALVICVAASAYPAFRAGKVKPAEDLRNY